MTPDEMVLASFIMLATLIGWALGYGHGQHRERLRKQHREPETHGGDGGRPELPAPADYSDEVTDEHLARIAELVDQDPSAYEPAPEVGSGERAGDESPYREIRLDLTPEQKKRLRAVIDHMTAEHKRRVE